MRLVCRVQHTEPVGDKSRPPVGSETSKPDTCHSAFQWTEAAAASTSRGWKLPEGECKHCTFGGRLPEREGIWVKAVEWEQSGEGTVKELGG